MWFSYYDMSTFNLTIRRHTCVVMILSDQHLHMPHLSGGGIFLGEVLTYTDVNKCVTIIWEKYFCWVHKKDLVFTLCGYISYTAEQFLYPPLPLLTLLQISLEELECLDVVVKLLVFHPYWCHTLWALWGHSRNLKQNLSISNPQCPRASQWISMSC